MSLLDRLYLCFDSITEKYGLFKVETIGDAYMLSGNILEEGKSDTHCSRVAQFALEAVAAAQTISVRLRAMQQGRENERDPRLSRARGPPLALLALLPQLESASCALTKHQPLH